MRGYTSFTFFVIALCCLALCIAMFTSAMLSPDSEHSSEDNLQSSSSLRRRLFHLFDDIAGVDPKFKAPIPYGTARKNFFVSKSFSMFFLFFAW